MYLYFICLCVFFSLAVDILHVDELGICISDTKEKPDISRLELFKLPGYAGVCLTYGTISIIQYGCLQWGPLYLVQDMKQSIITGN